MDTLAILTSSFLTIMTAATPFLFASTGELMVEKSGVLNLGVEGMMIAGAVSAFAVGVESGMPFLGVLAGGLAGLMLSMLFALLVLHLFANQVATGLALSIFGLGFSALVGYSYTGRAIDAIDAIHIPYLSDIPLFGKMLFGHDPLVYLALMLLFASGWFLHNTRMGLIVRAIGENHYAAHNIGYRVVLIRYCTIAFGGFMSGLGGAYLSVVYTPLWAENMTAGRGWIALALVVFASWLPARVCIGAIAFGGISIVQLHIQGSGIAVSSQLLSMLPYVATIVALILLSRRTGTHILAPASLGKNFFVDR